MCREDQNPAPQHDHRLTMTRWGRLPSLVDSCVVHHQHILTYNHTNFLEQACKCEICGGKSASLGVYYCGKCCYYVRIKRVMSEPLNFRLRCLSNGALCTCFAAIEPYLWISVFT